MSNPIPQVFDTGKRVLRTVVQVGIPTFVAFAAAVPALLAQAHLYLKPELYTALLGVAALITTAAAVITRIMAIPAVNNLLAQIGLGGHSGNVTAQDTYTRMIAAINPNGTAINAAGTIASGPQARVSSGDATH